ncbi:MAG: adenylate/guanylate cyclase domain-containing protein [Desulfuromonadaceae bacterium]|nr:adenylate/guanylate cyclase domain-containing protein [Desulfuromonadaceae bacterium]
MQKISLKKLIARDDALDLLQALIADTKSTISIEDIKGKVLLKDLGDPDGSTSCKIPPPLRLPVMLDEEVIGWVCGEGKVSAVANFISYLAQRENERKTLASEALDKYREINFLYGFAEKMSTCLDAKGVARLVLEETALLIPLTSASVMLYNEQTDLLEVVLGVGESNEPKLSMHPNEGIAGHIFRSGKPEIVNNVSADPRYKPHSLQLYSLICAPLMAKDRAIGVINISNTLNVNYTSQDLKLFSVLAIQATSAIENALLHENRLRQLQIKNNLGRYLSPQVVEAVINAKEGVSLNTSKRRITMLFSDIRNFSTKCEELHPEEIVSYLNEYFTHLVSVIFEHHGTVNKFVGDMIVAMFGAPSDLENQELCAILAAINMQRCLNTIPAPWIRVNFGTGIGISSGEAVVGNIGSSQHMDYTAIGDEVNIASRLQGLARSGQILVTRSVYDAVAPMKTESFSFMEFGTLQVKGKRNTVEIFEVIYAD